MYLKQSEVGRIVGFLWIFVRLEGLLELLSELLSSFPPFLGRAMRDEAIKARRQT